MRLVSFKTVKWVMLAGGVIAVFIAAVANVVIYRSESFKVLQTNLPVILHEVKSFEADRAKVFYLSGLEDKRVTAYDVIATDFRQCLSLTISMSHSDSSGWKILYVYESGDYGGLKQIYPPTSVKASNQK